MAGDSKLLFGLSSGIIFTDQGIYFLEKPSLIDRNEFEQRRESVTPLDFYLVSKSDFQYEIIPGKPFQHLNVIENKSFYTDIDEEFGNRYLTDVVLINRLLEKATTIEVPEELTMKGQFKELLQVFCTSRIRARSPEELNIGKPWTENDLTYFTIKGLQEFLKQRGFTNYTRPQLQQRLRDLNNGDNCHGVYKLKDDETGKWSNIRVWWVPEFHEEEIELPIEEKSNESDIPF